MTYSQHYPEWSNHTDMRKETRLSTILTHFNMVFESRVRAIKEKKNKLKRYKYGEKSNYLHLQMI